MKNLLLLSIILLSGFSVKAQYTLQLRGHFGVSGAMVNWNEDLEGANSVEMENFKEVGLLLSKGFGKNFQVNAGVNYSTAKNSIPMCVDYCAQSLTVYFNPDFKMLSIPIYAEYVLGKVFYAAAGPILDFQLSEGNNFSDQSGFGYLIGLGAKLKTEKLSFSILPNYKRHNVIPFRKEGNYKQVLQELGVQLGVGYSF